MISSLHGVVLARSADSLVVEVGGVGFAVAVSGELAHGARIGETIRLHTQLVVREDALSLYGFSDTEQLEVFAQLLTVTGVGPKSALGVIGHLSVEQIATAVAGEDDAPFRRVSGIGPKTAKLIVMQLAGKLSAPTRQDAASGASPAIIEQVVAALVGLGWPERIAAEAAERTVESANDTERSSAAALLRRTLATLGPAQAGVSRG